MSSPTPTPEQRTRFRNIASFSRARDGVAAIEFALLTPVIVVMLTGLISFGFVVYQKMEMTNAAHSGVQLALVDSSNISAIQDAVVASTNLGITTADVNVTEFCECADGSAVTCGSACGDGSNNRHFLTIDISMNATLLFWPDGSIPLSQTSTIRIQ